MEEVFHIAKELGYDGVEVWHFQLIKTREDAASLCKLARELSLKLSLHALSWDLNFTSKLSRVREASLEMLEKSILVAEALHADIVVVHPGRITIPGDDPEEYWGLLKEGVARLASYARPRGIEIGLEIMEHIPKEFFITPEDGNRILEEVNAPNLGITFDAAHVPLGIDPLAYLKRAKGVIHIHLSDIIGQKRHVALGKGVREFSDLIRYIVENLKVDIVIEGMEYQRDKWLIEHNKEKICELLKRR